MMEIYIPGLVVQDLGKRSRAGNHAHAQLSYEFFNKLLEAGH